MIKKCKICNTVHGIIKEIDGVLLCYHCFNMLLCAGWLFEGEDDCWHFENKEDLNLL